MHIWATVFYWKDLNIHIDNKCPKSGCVMQHLHKFVIYVNATRIAQKFRPLNTPLVVIFTCEARNQSTIRA